MTTTTTTPVSTQDTSFDIASISRKLEPVLAEHGEFSLIAALAHAIGVKRIIEAASAPVQRIFCEPMAADGANSQPPSVSLATLKPKGQGTRMVYYVAGCDGARRLANRLGRTIFKIGYTCEPTPADRLAGLDAVGYGGWAGFASATKSPKPGWNKWFFARHEARDTAHVILPFGIEIEQGLWYVDLPAGVDPEAFDRIVTAAMMPRQLAFWATSGEGRTHCRQKGVGTGQFVRFSRKESPSILRKTEELYVYSPRTDASWFAAILGEALAHVRRLLTIN